jgi:glycosyltransferase involved in cell wall biosynthesis
MISVCIATYNGEKYIRQQLESILLQLSTDDEVVISDDSSSDSTVAIIEEFRDSRIVLLKNNIFRSPIYNMENALKGTRGNYIFMSDQDDIWMNNRIKTTLDVFMRTDANLVICCCDVIDKNGNTVRHSYFKSENPVKGFLWNLYKNPYLGCCMAFDKKMLQLSLPFPPKLAMHDIWIGNLAKYYGKVVYENKSLVKYRRHENNFTKSDSGFSLYYKIKYRLYILINVIKRRGHEFKQ